MATILTSPVISELFIWGGGGGGILKSHSKFCFQLDPSPPPRAPANIQSVTVRPKNLTAKCTNKDQRSETYATPRGPIFVASNQSGLRAQIQIRAEETLPNWTNLQTHVSGSKTRVHSSSIFLFPAPPPQKKKTANASSCGDVPISGKSMRPAPPCRLDPRRRARRFCRCRSTALMTDLRRDVSSSVL